ncbi:MAG: biotin transporter BioY [Syntrophomonas sp.]
MMKISTREMVLAAMFTAMVCVLTILVRVFQPVMVIPFSLQPLVMLLAAYLLSPTAAFLSMLAYLMLGLIGLPVFSAPPYGGPAYVLIPSFGFLLAFPLAAGLQSKLIRKSNLINFILAGLAGVTVYYLVGLPYMYLILKFYLGHTVNVMQVIKLGFLPFIIFDILKILVASLIAVQLCRRLEIKREV